MSECPKLSVLVEELFDVKKKWYNIGLQLNVPEETLDEIECACRDDFEVALRRVLKEWRKQIEPRPTWDGLVVALRTRTVNEQELAANLEDRYVAGTSARAVSGPRELVPSTPSALDALNSVVVMRPNEVPDPEVQRDIDHLYQSFDALRMDVFTYLDKMQPDLREFSVFVSLPPPSWKTKRPKMMTNVDLDRIMDPETQFYQMFCVVSQYTSWYNYELLNKIVNRYGSPELKGKMEKYRNELFEFEGRTSTEVLTNIALGMPQSDSVTVIARLPDHHCNQFTARDVRNMKHKYTDEAGIDRAALRTHMINKSSVEIVFLVPIALAPYLMVSSVSPLLTSESPLPENMYERCIHMIYTEEVFRLMGRTVPPLTTHNSTDSTHSQETRTTAPPIFRNSPSSESFTSEAKSTAEESLSLYPSFDPSRMQVHVFHDKVLMNGDSAVVCKAQFLHLPCAAKYIHPKLAEGGNSWQLDCFENGCRILENCRHPNIITYLGVHRHDSLGVPILLMELMDHNLKEFLERAEGSLPLHVQLNICHDIAQGLEYLHAKDIIHGNLTATNVLVRDGTAKISGVMSLQENTPDGELSLCPGAPESLPLRSFSFSDYDEVIDCFSFGVLALHIATRETPKPRPLALQSSQSSEIERYERSLNEIKSTHPLNAIIIKCLNDEAKKRPSAAKLCRDLSDMKTSPEYRSSLEAERVTTTLMGLQIEHLQKEIREQNDEKEALKNTLTTAQTELREQEEALSELSHLQQQTEGELQKARVNTEQMERLSHEKEVLTNQLQEKQAELQQQSEKFHEQSRLREQAERELRVDKDKKENLIKMLTLHNNDLEEKIAAASRDVEQYRYELSEERKKCSTELKKVVAEKEKMCRDLQSEQGKTGTMEHKITKLKAARDDYKVKFEASDKTCAELYSQLQDQEARH